MGSPFPLYTLSMEVMEDRGGCDVLEVAIAALFQDITTSKDQRRRRRRREEEEPLAASATILQPLFHPKME